MLFAHSHRATLGWKIDVHQTLANRGPDMRFLLEVIITALISKSSQSSILITLNLFSLESEF